MSDQAWNILFATIAVFALCSYMLERRAWNRGQCRQCSAQLVYFDTDSQGGRGYRCSQAWSHPSVWISWPFIARKRKENV